MFWQPPPIQSRGCPLARLQLFSILATLQTYHLEVFDYTVRNNKAGFYPNKANISLETKLYQELATLISK